MCSRSKKSPHLNSVPAPKNSPLDHTRNLTTNTIEIFVIIQVESTLIIDKIGKVRSPGFEFPPALFWRNGSRVTGLEGQCPRPNWTMTALTVAEAAKDIKSFNLGKLCSGPCRLPCSLSCACSTPCPSLARQAPSRPRLRAPAGGQARRRTGRGCSSCWISQ